MVSLDEAGRDAPPVRPPLPGSGLTPFVEHAWIQNGPAGAKTGDLRRVVPDPSPHIVIAAYEGRVLAHVVGARTYFCDVDALRRFTVGVRLRPGTLPRLTGHPGGEFTDRSIRLEDVLTETTRVLDLGAAGDAEGCLEALLTILESRLAAASSRDWRIVAMERLWRQPGPAPEIRELARQVGVAERTLRAVSFSEVGISPSEWRRLQRALWALEMALSPVSSSLSRIAVSAGYFDHSHMVREFRRLFGETPSDFLSRRASCRSVQARESAAR